MRFAAQRVVLCWVLRVCMRVSSMWTTECAVCARIACGTDCDRRRRSLAATVAGKLNGYARAYAWKSATGWEQQAYASPASCASYFTHRGYVRVF